MSKVRRRPANHGKHVDPSEIRRQNDPSETRRPGDPSETRRLDDPADPAEMRQQSDPSEIRRRSDPSEIRRRSDPSEIRRHNGNGADGHRSEDPAPAAAQHAAWTTAGDYLRSVAVDDAPARFGTPSGPVDDYARRVWHTAFGLAVRRRFEPDSPLAEISRSAAAAAHAHEAAGLPAIDVEMLVRAELGEQVPVDEFDPAELVGVHLLVFASLVDELALGDGELDDLVTQAEQVALAAV